MASEKQVLVTGGAGYVGSHVVVELLKEGYHVIVIDRLNDSKLEVLRQIEVITGKPAKAHNIDLTDRERLNQVFRENNIYCVIHLAAKKSHLMSIKYPLIYYKDNVFGLLTVLEVMKANGVYRLIYGSSFAVYGRPKYLPFDELHPTGDVKDPYSRTKYFCEEILKDLCTAEKDWNIVTLRLFNPAGAHKSGLIGEIMTDDPPNLMPNIAKVALGIREQFTIYGDKYSTRDGTGERDYTHVVDVAKGHVAAARKMDNAAGYKVYNLGTGSPCSALTMVKEFEKASGKTIPIIYREPRSYDTPTTFADVSLAKTELDWNAGLDVTHMCTDAWRWYINNDKI